jgi:ABC-2 type transport system permease protein
VPVEEPLILILAVGILLVLFGSLGVVVGIYARDLGPGRLRQQPRDPPADLPGRRLLLGRPAPSPWHELSHLNPIFYLVQAVRYGFLGSSDVSVALALLVTGTLAAATVAWSAWLFRTGRRLKPSPCSRSTSPTS